MSTLQQRHDLGRQATNLPDFQTNPATAGVKAWWLDVAAAHALPVVVTLALVWLATIALAVISYFVTANLVPIVYMLPVVVAATQWGRAQAILAAISGTAAADFFFCPPLYSFSIQDPLVIVDLALFLLVAIVTSNLAARRE